jgi:hypothetical protein
MEFDDMQSKSQQNAPERRRCSVGAFIRRLVESIDLAERPEATFQIIYDGPRQESV